MSYRRPAVEINSLRTKHSDTEREQGYTILDEVKKHYDNLFYRTQTGYIAERSPPMTARCMNSPKKWRW